MEKYLVESVGLSSVEAQARMQDSDLWLVEPEQRLALRDEAAIERLERAGHAVGDLAMFYAEHGRLRDEMMVLLLDARDRAAEAARRARERLEG